MEEKDNCLFCKSKNLAFIKSDTIMTKNYVKQLAQNYTENGWFSYHSVKYACLECGAVFEIIPKNELKSYHEDKKYFK